MIAKNILAVFFSPPKIWYGMNLSAMLHESNRVRRIHGSSNSPVALNADTPCAAYGDGRGQGSCSQGCLRGICRRLLSVRTGLDKEHGKYCKNVMAVAYSKACSTPAIICTKVPSTSRASRWLAALEAALSFYAQNCAFPLPLREAQNLSLSMSLYVQQCWLFKRDGQGRCGDRRGRWQTRA